MLITKLQIKQTRQASAVQSTIFDFLKKNTDTIKSCSNVFDVYFCGESYFFVQTLDALGFGLKLSLKLVLRLLCLNFLWANLKFEKMRSMTFSKIQTHVFCSQVIKLIIIASTQRESILKQFGIF